MAEVHESLGTIEDVFATASPKTLPVIKKAHKLLLALHPAAVVVPRAKEKSIAYGFGTKKMSEAYCYLMPFKEHINLGFFHGTKIDPKGELEGTGANMRHLKIESIEDLSSARVSRFVKAAMKERKAFLAGK